MTPLQNDPKQHHCEAKNLKVRVPRGGARSPDPDSLRTLLQQAGLGSNFDLQNINFTSNPGRGIPAGAPTCTRVRPNRNQCITKRLSRTPYCLRCWGKYSTYHSPNVSMNTCIWAHAHADGHVHMHTRMHAHMCTQASTQACANTYTKVHLTDTFMHSHTYTNTNA
jgi:hypothetical protein